MSYKIMTVDEVQGDLDEARRMAQDTDVRRAHKDVYSNPYEREAERLEKLLEFVKAGVPNERVDKGTILVKGKFIVSLTNPKWRVKGKPKWYYYGKPEDFLYKYK